MRYSFSAKVERVIDGDTLDVTVDLGFKISHRVHLRLAEVNTPELNSPDPALKKKALEAKATVEEFVRDSGGYVQVDTYKTEKYGRYLAVVFGRGGISLNTLLISQGYFSNPK